jgi:hypothetical protein
VGTLPVFTVYFFKVILREFIISSVAVKTIEFLFHPQLPGMRKGGILFRMTIGAAEAFMIGIVIFIPFNYTFRAHQRFHLPPKVFICIFVLRLPVTFKASFIIIMKR